MTATLSVPLDQPKLTQEAARIGSWRYAAELILVALAYTLTGRIGLSLDPVSGFATLVWAPSGIALGVLLLGGMRLWPGILAGAVAVNLWSGAPIPVALGIGVGNTLEAVTATYLLRQIRGFRVSLDQLLDVLGVIVFGAVIATMVAATIGTLSLHLGGIVPRTALAETWRAWWIGDGIGILLVTPVILVWSATTPGTSGRGRLLEALLIAGVVIVAAIAVFFFTTPAELNPIAQPFVFFPILILASIRFGKRGAVTAVGLVSIIAIWGTAMGHGPFVRESLHSSLFALQMWMGVAAGTFLILGASVSERRRAEIGLRRAHDVATDANRAKAEFLAVMSHELRTPLNAISGYAELLSLGLADPLTAKQEDAVTRIRTSQQHLLALIDDVLSFAKMEAGRSEILPRPVFLRETLDGLEPILRPQLMRKKLAYSCEPCDSAIEVLADPPKLRQILLNILGNAIKFTGEGGGIELRAARKGKDVVVTVRDTGIGIPEDKLERIFEPFYQVERGTTRRYEGVGLGLAISRDLARTMGGEVVVDSVLGEGTTVTVTLPAIT
jgi:signal transduction histidine kinase